MTKASGYPSLDSCPVEILNLIFELLSPTEYHLLSLVNHKLRVTAEPFLYSNLQCIWEEVCFPPPIIRFLQTIIRRPDLASHLKRIHLDGDRFLIGYQRNIKPKIPVSEVELDELSSFIRATGAPYCDMWIQELENGSTDAIIALLLAQSSNLRYLYIGPVFTQLSKLIGLVLHSRLCEPTIDLQHHYSLHDKIPNFENLRDITFLMNVEDDQDAHLNRSKNTAHVLPFFYLPNIQRLSLSVENERTWTWPTATQPNPSTLTSLDLTCIRELHLASVLSVTQNVQTLRWQLYHHERLNPPITPHDDPRSRKVANSKQIYLDLMADAICLVRDSLTELTISATVDITCYDLDTPWMVLRGSSHALHNMYKVKKLQIPLVFLVGTGPGGMGGIEKEFATHLQDAMPRNVEFVTLTYDLRDADVGYWQWKDHEVLELLERWLEDWRACTPKLQGIFLLFDWESEDEWCPRMRDQARELGARTGVTLEVIPRNSAWGILNQRMLILNDRNEDASGVRWLY